MALVQDRLITRLELVGLGQYTNGLAGAADALGLVDVATGKLQQRQLALGIASGAAALGIARGLAKTVQAAGRMQQVEIAFETLEGSASAAQARIAELQEFASRTPFDFEQSVKGAQQLRAMGIEGDKLIPVMEAVGNAVSASGGDTETFLGALRAIGQIQTKGRVQAEELLQLAERGIPAYQILQEELGLTADQMAQIGREGLPAAQAVEALTRGFNKRFGGALEKQSNTLQGSFSNLGDASFQLAAAIGGPLVGPVTLATQGITGLVNALNSAPGPVKGLITLVGVGLVGALAAYSVAQFKALIGTTRLIQQTIQLANAQLQSAAAARQQAAAMGQVGAAANAAAARSAVPVAGPSATGKGRFGKWAGTAAAVAGVAATEAAVSASGGGSAMDGLGKIGGRAAEGAMLGMMAGPKGALLGGLIGGGVGAVESIFAGGGVQTAKPKTETAEDLLKEQNDLLRQQLAALKDLPRNLPVNTNVLPATAQLQAISAIGHLA